MEYEIVKDSICDLAEIVELNRKIFIGMYESEPYSLSQYKSRLEGKNPLIGIVNVDNEIIANSIAFRKENSLYLWILGVSKYHRNRGIASRLFDLNEDFARNNGIDSVNTKVYPVSKEMIQLVEKRGYEITKTDAENGKAIHFRLDL
jgi:ribosomal protein S18 acetylase RimI-like enzyme